MLTLQKRRILSLMDIPVWRQRGNEAAQPVSPPVLSDQQADQRIEYTALEVNIAAKQATFTVVSSVLSDANEINLLKAIVGAMGDIVGDVQPRKQFDKPIIALGLSADAVFDGQSVTHFNYTIKQLVDDPALKRPLWQQIKAFLR